MSNQEQTQEKKPLSREDRLTLAQCYYGWYTFGMATTDSERVDEDCAMDNNGVPYYEDQLTDKHKEVLARFKATGSRVDAEPDTINLEVPMRLDDSQADKLHKIITRRHARTRHVPENEAGQQYEVIGWAVRDDIDYPDETLLISCHASQTEADKALERYTARMTYMNIKQFQIKETLNFNK